MGPSGVVGDGARGKIGRGTWETRRDREEVTQPKGLGGINNLQGCSVGSRRGS
jgi:hypothetical protein